MATLKNKARVVLTRENNDAVASILRANGIDVLDMPLIKVKTTVEESDFKDVMEEMGHYNWITFSSANGVRGFFEAFFNIFDDIRCLGFAHIACVGDATAQELKKYYLRAQVVPSVANAIAMAEAMNAFETLDNLRILCVRGNLSTNELHDKLEKDYGAIVDNVSVYTTTHTEIQADLKEVADFRKFGADIVVFASPSAVESFAKNAKNLKLDKKAVHPKIVTIGATTSEAVKKFGMTVAAESESPSPQDVVNAIGRAL